MCQYLSRRWLFSCLSRERRSLRRSECSSSSRDLRLSTRSSSSRDLRLSTRSSSSRDLRLSTRSSSLRDLRLSPRDRRLSRELASSDWSSLRWPLRRSLRSTASSDCCRCLRRSSCSEGRRRRLSRGEESRSDSLEALLLEESLCSLSDELDADGLGVRERLGQDLKKGNNKWGNTKDNMRRQKDFALNEK